MLLVAVRVKADGTVFGAIHHQFQANSSPGELWGPGGQENNCACVCATERALFFFFWFKG